jgi:uncharacterized delta-60 repeat protein
MPRKIICFFPFILNIVLGFAYAAPGELDTRFNSPNGFAIYDSGFSDGGESIAIQNDGKIILGGWIQRSGQYDALLLRYRFDGTLDNTFGTNGVVVYNGGSSKRGVGTAIQTDGKILITGAVYGVGNDDLFILRVSNDGTPDSTFGANGIVTYDSGFSDLGWRIALQSDGKILVAGVMATDTDLKLLLIRYNVTGVLDTAFGSNGVVVYDDTMPLGCKGIALQPDGKIVVLASKNEADPEGSDILLLRYNTNGTLDTDFGSNGVVKYDSGQVDMGRSLAIQADGKVVVAGYTSSSAWTDYRAIVLRFNLTGAPDTSFGLNGLAEYSEGSFDAAWSLAVQPDGKIILVGDTQGQTNTDVLVLRYNGDGTLDTNFGRGGVVHYDSGFRDGAISVAISPGGGIVVGAWFLNAQYDLRVLKFRGGDLVRPIPDTGQTKCYNNTGEIPCPQPGEPFYGQDANYTINPPSYTKLDPNGNDLPDDATEWAMVRDNVTGLIWEVKQNKDGVQDYSNPHDADNTYTWYDGNPATNGGYAGTPGDGTDTEDFVNALNAANFGGHSDWRVPSRKELRTIADYARMSPSINTAYFPNTVPSFYWSSTTYVFDQNAVLLMLFFLGYDGCIDKSSFYYARAVRGGQTENRFIDNGDGTVTDLSTGLMWQQATAPGTYTWEQALSYSENLTLAGHSDWRLPTIKELDSIVDLTRQNLTINPVYFPDTRASFYWSSTTYISDMTYPWSISFNYGMNGNLPKSYDGYIRAVRRGQPAGLADLNGDGSINLTDAILAIRITAGLRDPDVDVRADVNGDGKIGMAEVVYILQKIAGLR